MKVGGYGDLIIMANKYRQSLIKAVAFYEGISQRKATTIVSSRIKQIRAINKGLKGSDIKLNPYRQFEREYFGGEETLYDRYQVIYERFDHFLDKYGNRDISFIYNNKEYNMTMKEVVNAYAKGEVSATFIRRAIQALENRYADYIKANYNRH